MARKRSAVAQVLGILHLVGGGLGLLLGCAGIFALLLISSQTPGGTPGPAASTVPTQAEMQAYLVKNAPAYQEFQYGSTAVSLLLAVLLIAGGIGLLMQKSWGRTVSLIYAPISIVNHIVGTTYSLLYVVPGTLAFLQASPAAGPPGQQQIVKFSTYGGAILGGLIVAYPIVVLCLLLRPSVAAALRADDRGGRDPDGDDFDDREDYDDRDRPGKGDRGQPGDDDPGRGPEVGIRRPDDRY